MERKHMESATDLVTSIGKFYVQAFAQPMTALGGSLAASREMLKSLAGQSEIEPDKSDKRFKDPVWTSNPGYRFLMRSYLAWSRAITGWVDGLGVPERDKLRVKLLANLVIDAMAPTNALLTNPTAMKATLDAGGQNLVAGVQHFMHDMVANNGLPSMVDKSGFRLGKNLATSEGKVVYAEDHLELIQYAPKTKEVWKTPVFIVPPQINKFYIWDLAPGRSIVEYLVGQGHQVFILSWRNPSEAQADWDLESYVLALDRATVPSDFPLELADRLRAAGTRLEVDRRLFEARRRVKSEAELMRRYAALGGELQRIAVAHAEGEGFWRPAMSVTQLAVLKPR